MYCYSSHPLQACIVCLVLLCNCIHLWATPTRIAEWPKLQLFGENARVTLSREIRRSTMSMAASNHPDTAPGLSSSPSSTRSSSRSKMASSSTSSMSTPPSSTMTFGCASCKLRGQDGGYPGEQGSRSSTMTATEKQLRIQALKRQILDALNLPEPPKLKSNPPTISQEVMEKVFGESENANNKVLADDREDDDVDNIESDFKERDKQFILGVAGPANGFGNDWAMKMSFFLSESVQVAEVVSGKLWIHVLNSTSAIRRSIVVTQRLTQTNIVASHLVNDTGGWIGIDLSPSWSSSEPSVVFEVTTDPAHEATINMTARPILEVRVLTRVRHEVHRRARRGATCKSNNPSTCCLQAFTVTKTELGWDWLIHPTEMVVNYCRGSCDSGIYHMYNHSDIMYTRGMLETDTSLRALLMPCCTSKRLTSVQLIYYQDGSAMTTKNIPNLKVLECGCA